MRSAAYAERLDTAPDVDRAIARGLANLGGEDNRTPAERVPLEHEPPRWRTPAERALSIGHRGERMATGLDTLDRVVLRGGFLPQKFCIVGGAPGAGKTTLLVQLGRHYHRAGHAVAVLAADEDADALLIRWGQLEGLERDAMELGDEHARERLAACVTSDRLVFVDPDEDADVTIESVAARIAELAKPTGKPGVLIVDSLQTARCAASEGADTPRAKLDAVVRACRGLAKQHGLLVLATSEMARGFYRGGGVPGTDALASFKESGSIEYQATVALAMRNVKGEPDAVDVEVPKSRLGRSGVAFRLQLDRRAAEFSEIELREEADDGAGARAAAEDAKVAKLGEQLLRRLATNKAPVTNMHQLRGLLRGVGNPVRARVIAEMQNAGRIVGGGRLGPYRVASVEADDDDGGDE